MASSVRVRIAPSPTGAMHVGLARTALFNELFARREGGAFIIRTEDTDKARSKPEYEQKILEGLRWLGLQWDEGPDIGGPYGPYRQSERSAFYKEALEKLLTDKKAEYSDKAIRLLVEPQTVTFEDSVRGKVTVHTDTFGGGFIIARALDDPVFHLAVVVDDAAMKISHVIRGEDHISNTAKHILLQRALGYPQPIYAHLPLLLDEQRRKLSKRVHNTDLLSYREQGYLPEAMLNYLALLGWNPKTDQEFFTHEELRQLFSLGGVQKGGAIFSAPKLNAVNKHYLQQLSEATLLEQIQPYLTAANIIPPDRDWLSRALQVERGRATTLSELAQLIKPLLPGTNLDFSIDLLCWKKNPLEAAKNRLNAVVEQLRQLSDIDFTEATLKEKLLSWIDETKQGRGETLWPLRVALTGQEHSAGPFEVAAVLGKTETVRRLQQALDRLS